MSKKTVSEEKFVLILLSTGIITWFVLMAVLVIFCR